MTWNWSAAELTRLGGYLAERKLCGPAVVAQAVGDGHSNLTYLVSDGRRQVVVRRPPPPPTPPGAHDVLREARLVGALQHTPVPVPRVLAIARAGEILNVPLVVTEFVDAVVITELTPAPLDTPETRRQIALSMVDILADLHGIDWRDCGLADFGKPVGFNRRHLRRACTMVADPGGSLPVAFVALADRLSHTVPPESAHAIVHNDFRIGNLMVARAAPGRAVAVLDWELATIGDPLADLGYFLASYPRPGEPLTPTAAMGTATLEDGFPARDELLNRYCARTGADATGVTWYCALAQFKLAALYEYGRRRAIAGVGDPYFGDPALVNAFLRAGERMVC
jgi:aminoglycoside phosphotransferase (APT) family kinase protein